MVNQTVTTGTSNFKLVQAVEGCVQLRAGDSTGILYLNLLGQQVGQEPGIVAVSTDAKTGDLIIVFNPHVIPLIQVLEMLQEWGISGIKTDQDPVKQVGNFLLHHQELETLAPMIAGMLVTQTLKLRGGWALLGNLIAASVTRQAIAQLEQNSTDAAVITVPAVVSPAATAPKSAVKAPSGMGVEIVHAIPGRVRLRVPKIAQDSTCADRLQTALCSQPEVTEIRLNPLTASIVVQYEIAAGLDESWRSHLVEMIEQAIADSLPEETPTPETDSQEQPEYPEETPGVLEIESDGSLTPDTADPVNYFNPCFARAFMNTMMNRFMGASV
ncbi:HMA2 domain-containing protein [Oscillatoria acuminata]|uniref:Uncharacterized protein n=1 Tax=Oscillatoria acuminata PCC 6304 TaxID=56110 RepID=K9TK77_9CYAN|nr:hypothetical protein [Oscillatoria acuminata]AFY82950.1 hypothetical protein Oscil6304_3380 [Oscillatoria acuminata PCC 6304]